MSMRKYPMLPSVKGFKRTRVSMFMLLLPLPFLLSNLGVTFVVIATLLNLGWLGFRFYNVQKESNQTKWWRRLFIELLSSILCTRCSCFINNQDDA